MTPEKVDVLVLGSGVGAKLMAWHMAKSGHRTGTVERRWIGEVMAAVQTAMVAKLPYTGVRDANYTDRTIEGLNDLFEKVPPLG
jgi:alkyl hydroperoxide reductase subunit AhpF